MPRQKAQHSQILQKIKYVKGLSSRNRFVFVYATNLPETTRNALEEDGVMHMSFDELLAFIARMELQLRLQGDLTKLRDEDFDRDFRRRLPPGMGPMDFLRLCS